MMDLNKVLEVFKLNDGSYLVKIDLDCCEDNKEDKLLMSYKEKSEEDKEVDDLFISAKDEKEVCELVSKYLPMIIAKDPEEIVFADEENFKNVKTS